MGIFYFAGGLLVAVTSSVVGVARRDRRYLYVAALIVVVFLSGLPGQKFIILSDPKQIQFFSQVGPWGLRSVGLIIGISIFATALAGRLRWSAFIVIALTAAWIAHTFSEILYIYEGAGPPS